jgi:TolA-binding protein
MRRILLPLLAFSLIAPAAHSAGTYEPAPAPVVTNSPAPTPTSEPAPTPTPEPAPTPTPEPSSNTSTAPEVTPAPTPTPVVVAATVQSEITRVSAIIYSGDYKGARAELLKIDKAFPNDANVNNLLGYTSRKLGQLAPSAAYYKKALAINPRHLGALEYQGELFVMQKKYKDARKNLKKLGQLCGLDCAEYKDLKLAIDKKR